MNPNFPFVFFMVTTNCSTAVSNILSSRSQHIWAAVEFLHPTFHTSHCVCGSHSPTAVVNEHHMAGAIKAAVKIEIISIILSYISSQLPQHSFKHDLNLIRKPQASNSHLNMWYRRDRGVHTHTCWPVHNICSHLIWLRYINFVSLSVCNQLRQMETAKADVTFQRLSMRLLERQQLSTLPALLPWRNR